MSDTGPTLHLICGKIASGKSTLAARLAEAPGHVLIAEDAWLAHLFGAEMKTGADYLTCSARLRAAIESHVVALLGAGLSVVLDFPANTPVQRDWMRGLFQAAGAAHQMHVLDLADDICLARLAARNAAGTHAFAVTAAQFARFGAHFSLPQADEGFTLIHHHDVADHGAR